MSILLDLEIKILLGNLNKIFSEAHQILSPYAIIPLRVIATHDIILCYHKHCTEIEPDEPKSSIFLM